MTGFPDDPAVGPDGHGPDPVEPLLRYAPEYLSAPPGAFERIRRRAARRRRVRAAVGGTVAVAVVAGALYLVGAVSPNGGDEVVGPPASTEPTTSAPTVPAPSSARPTTPPSRTSTTPRPPSGDPLPTATTTTGGEPTTTPGTTSDAPPATTPMCAASQLTAALGGGDAGAGNLYRYLVLTNHGATACHVTGYPGLSMLDADGEEIGAPATHQDLAYESVVLRPGASASDTIHTVNQQGTCLPTSVTLRLYPPGSRASLDFPGQITNCDNLFSVTPFTAGNTGNPAS